MQVQSLAPHSGLRIRHCRNCGLVHNCSSDLIPGPEAPYAAGQPKKKNKILFPVWFNICSSDYGQSAHYARYPVVSSVIQGP